MSHKARRLVLRGYVKEAEPGLYVGVCLTLNLVVQGPSQTEVLCRLQDLIASYLEDALENDEVEQFVPRRAPLHFYGEYCFGRFVGFWNLLRYGFLVFKDNRLIPAHA